MVLGPHYPFCSNDSEVEKLIDGSVFKAIDMDSSLDHLSGIVQSVFKSEKDPSIRIFVEVGSSHSSENI